MLPFTRVLTLVVIVTVLAFSVRVSELVTGVRNISPVAMAETPKKEESSHGDEAASHEEDTHSQEVSTEKNNAPAAPVWRDASDSDFDISNIKMEMFEDLAARRKELEKMERDYFTREALLKAAEKELERKYQELEALKTEIEGLLEQQSEEELARIDALVKIYEGMKPKEAARIFDTLDIDVLVSVLGKMSARKVSPVLAAMNPERARTVTIMLAEEKTLPSL